MQQLDLFANPVPQPPQPSPIEQRRKAMKKSFDASVDAWKQAYRKFILHYLETVGDASAETIREAYMADTALPQTGSQQASGQIFVGLRRSGQIREVRRELSKKFGNLLAVYQRVNEVGEGKRYEPQT